jgi:hypothetical protein
VSDGAGDGETGDADAGSEAGEAGEAGDRIRVVSCALAFTVMEAAEVAVQVAAADSAGRVQTERFEVATDGAPPVSLEEVRNPQGERIHVIHSDPGRLTVTYRAEIEARPPRSSTLGPNELFDGAARPSAA